MQVFIKTVLLINEDLPDSGRVFQDDRKFIMKSAKFRLIWEYLPREVKLLEIKRFLLPAKSLNHMFNILFQEFDDRSEGVVVGDQIKVKGTT